MKCAYIQYVYSGCFRITYKQLHVKNKPSSDYSCDTASWGQTCSTAPCHAPDCTCETVIRTWEHFLQFSPFFWETRAHLWQLGATLEDKLCGIEHSLFKDCTIYHRSKYRCLRLELWSSEEDTALFFFLSGKCFFFQGMKENTEWNFQVYVSYKISQRLSVVFFFNTL